MGVGRPLTPSADHQCCVTNEKQCITVLYNIRRSTSIYDLEPIQYEFGSTSVCTPGFLNSAKGTTGVFTTCASMLQNTSQSVVFNGCALPFHPLQKEDFTAFPCCQRCGYSNHNSQSCKTGRLSGSLLYPTFSADSTTHANSKDTSQTAQALPATTAPPPVPPAPPPSVPPPELQSILTALQNIQQQLNAQQTSLRTELKQHQTSVHTDIQKLTTQLTQLEQIPAALEHCLVKVDDNIQRLAAAAANVDTLLKTHAGAIHNLNHCLTAVNRTTQLLSSHLWTIEEWLK
ncbi:hypothetical protein DFJ73DRAFT_911396 [Zopfochytrium polystomum]|nr:hypothetical protein DFJ73DRAFT_911396 [Zopfochytrium polystomum]